MKPTVNSYFSGAGLFDIGLSQTGIDIQQSFEIDSACVETQQKNFDHEVIQADITQKLAFDEKDCDVMVATYPCKKYSTGADINGTRTGDSLFLHFFRHVALKKPEMYIVENVPGMKKFPVVMEAMMRLPEYYTWTFCPVKAEWFLPQQRDRLIIIGSRKPFIWREPENRRAVSLADIVEDDPQVDIPDYLYNRLSGEYRDKPIISDPAKGDIAPTCLAHYAKDRSTRVVVDKRFKKNVRPYSPREYARLQGVPDWFKFSGTANQIYRQVGNGVPVPIGRWVGTELARYFNYSRQTKKVA